MFYFTVKLRLFILSSSAVLENYPFIHTFCTSITDRMLLWYIFIWNQYGFFLSYWSQIITTWFNHQPISEHKNCSCIFPIRAAFVSSLLHPSFSHTNKYCSIPLLIVIILRLTQKSTLVLLIHPLSLEEKCANASHLSSSISENVFDFRRVRSCSSISSFFTSTTRSIMCSTRFLRHDFQLSRF